MTNKYISDKELAGVIGLSRYTLQRYRCEGGGPPFIKLKSRVLYDVVKATAWLS